MTISEDTLYTQLYNHMRFTDDVSFKLLGIVPLLSGVGILALFWADTYRPVPADVVWTLALFATLVTLAMFRWEMHNIQVCWNLMQRVGALETRFVSSADFRVDPVVKETLAGLIPPLRIDKPQAEAFVYGGTMLVWLIVPELHSKRPWHWEMWVWPDNYLLLRGILAVAGLWSFGETVYCWWNKKGSALFPRNARKTPDPSRSDTPPPPV